MVTEPFTIPGAIGTAWPQTAHHWQAWTTPLTTTTEFHGSVSPIPSQYLRLANEVAAWLRGFPEIQAVYQRLTQDRVEFYVLADFPRDREDEFYSQEAAWRRAAVGILSLNLLNPRHFDNPPDFSPPRGTTPLKLPLT